MPRILISYRRIDVPLAAGWIAHSLKGRFGASNVFLDIDNMPPGRDFRVHLRGVLDQVDVLLAIIGPNWSEVDEKSGRPRLDDSNDWVRVEIASALARSDVLVIPVTVNGAKLPKAAELPEDLATLPFRHGLVFQNDQFAKSIERLVQYLEAASNRPEIIAPSPSQPPSLTTFFQKWRIPLSGFAALFLFTIAGVITWEQKFAPSPLEIVTKDFTANAERNETFFTFWASNRSSTDLNCKVKLTEQMGTEQWGKPDEFTILAKTHKEVYRIEYLYIQPRNVRRATFDCGRYTEVVPLGGRE